MSLAGDSWVLLHGTPLTPAVWDGVAARLRPRGHVLYTVAAPAGDAGDAPAELATRLASSHGGLPDRMHVVGHSFGGQVALDLALRPNSTRYLPQRPCPPSPAACRGPAWTSCRGPPT